MFAFGVLGSPLLNPSYKLTGPIPAGTIRQVMHRNRITRVVLILFALTLLSAAAMTAAFHFALTENPTVAATPRNIGFGGGVAAFSLTFLTTLHRHWAPYTAPLAALAGGIFMSGLALGFEPRFPGIAVQSIFLTLAIFASMLFLHAIRLVTVSRKLFTIVYTATAAIAITYLGGFLLALLGIHIPFLHGAGIGGILWFGFIVVIASLNLLVDFDRISRLEGRPYPKYMPWLVGLGLMITLVWLYVSVLRLLANLRR